MSRSPALSRSRETGLADRRGRFVAGHQDVGCPPKQRTHVLRHRYGFIREPERTSALMKCGREALPGGIVRVLLRRRKVVELLRGHPTTRRHHSSGRAPADQPAPMPCCAPVTKRYACHFIPAHTLPRSGPTCHMRPRLRAQTRRYKPRSSSGLPITGHCLVLRKDFPAGSDRRASA